MKLGGYQIIFQLERNNDFTIYRAIETSTSGKFLILAFEKSLYEDVPIYKAHLEKEITFLIHATQPPKFIDPEIRLKLQPTSKPNRNSQRQSNLPQILEIRQNGTQILLVITDCIQGSLVASLKNASITEQVIKSYIVQIHCAYSTFEEAIKSELIGERDFHINKLMISKTGLQVLDFGFDSIRKGSKQTLSREVRLAMLIYQIAFKRSLKMDQNRVHFPDTPSISPGLKDLITQLMYNTLKWAGVRQLEYLQEEFYQEAVLRPLVPPKLYTMELRNPYSTPKNELSFIAQERVKPVESGPIATLRLSHRVLNRSQNHRQQQLETRVIKVGDQSYKDHFDRIKKSLSPIRNVGQSPISTNQLNSTGYKHIYDSSRKMLGNNEDSIPANLANSFIEKQLYRKSTKISNNVLAQNHLVSGYIWKLSDQGKVMESLTTRQQDPPQPRSFQTPQTKTRMNSGTLNASGDNRYSRQGSAPKDNNSSFRFSFQQKPDEEIIRQSKREIEIDNHYVSVKDIPVLAEAKQNPSPMMQQGSIEIEVPQPHQSPRQQSRHSSNGQAQPKSFNSYSHSKANSNQFEEAKVIQSIPEKPKPQQPPVTRVPSSQQQAMGELFIDKIQQQQRATDPPQDVSRSYKTLLKQKQTSQESSPQLSRGSSADRSKLKGPRTDNSYVEEPQQQLAKSQQFEDLSIDDLDELEAYTKQPAAKQYESAPQPKVQNSAKDPEISPPKKNEVQTRSYTQPEDRNLVKQEMQRVTEKTENDEDERPQPINNTVSDDSRSRGSSNSGKPRKKKKKVKKLDASDPMQVPMNQYEQQIMKYDIIGRTAASCIKHFQAQKNFWMIPLFIVFKRMTYFRKELERRMGTENLLGLDESTWRTIQSYEPFQKLQNRIQQENIAVVKELETLLNIAKVMVGKLSPNEAKKIEKYINLDFSQNVQDIYFIYFYTQLFKTFKTQAAKEGDDAGKQLEDMKLQIQILCSIIISELPFCQDDPIHFDIQNHLANMQVTELKALKNYLLQKEDIVSEMKERLVKKGHKI